MDVSIIRKLEEINFGQFLSHAEFRCRCINTDCTFTMMNHRLQNGFNILRKYWGSAIGVSSGYRCMRHNKVVGGMDDSYHKKGSAIDIFPHAGDLLGLFELAKTIFDTVVLYEDEGFIHCQMEDK